MAWGSTSSAGCDDLFSRVAADDARLSSLTLFRSRRFGAPEVASLCAALATNTRLTSLDCGGHALSREAAAALAAALPRSAVARLRCGDGGFGDACAAALAPGCGGLVALDLEARGLGAEGAASLARLLSSGARCEELLLAHNPFGDDGAAALVAAALAGGASGSLRLLELGCCGFTHAASASLAPLLQHSASLRVIHLAGNALGPTGVSQLASSLPRSRLEELHLADTACGDGGAAALGAALHALGAARRSDAAAAGGGGGGGLRFLDIRRCGITAAGCAALRGPGAGGGSAGEAALCDDATVATADPSLRTLLLAGNAFGCDGAAALGGSGGGGGGGGGSHALSRVARLDVGCCALGGPGAAALLRCLRALQHLELLGNPLGDAGGAAVAHALKEHHPAAAAAALPPPPVAAVCVDHAPPPSSSLTSLGLSGTRLGSSGVAAVAGALRNGAAPRLALLELGSLPAADDDGWEGTVEALRGDRPGVDVAWRPAGGGDDGGGAA